RRSGRTSPAPRRRARRCRRRWSGRSPAPHRARRRPRRGVRWSIRSWAGPSHGARMDRAAGTAYRVNGTQSHTAWEGEQMQRVGVVGCGLMGAGITEVAARAGLDVVVVESGRAAADAGRARLEKSLARAESRGKIDSAAAVLEHIRVETELDALADREVVVEAIL